MEELYVTPKCSLQWNCKGELKTSEVHILQNLSASLLPGIIQLDTILQVIHSKAAAKTNKFTDESMNKRNGWMGLQHDQSPFSQMHSCVFQVFEVTGLLSRHSVRSPAHEERMEGILPILFGSSVPSMWLGPTPASNWKLPSMLRACMKLI